MTALCGCGCGERVPRRFVRGHNTKTGPDLSRYRIEDRGYVSPCHVWIGATNGHEYPMCSRGYVHRLVCESSLGRSLFPDEEVDHLCRVSMCINSEHLEPVSPTENKRREHGGSLLPERDWSEALAMRARGTKLCEIAELMQCSVASASIYLRRFG